MSASVLILTLNEEINLPACLKSVSWSDDIVVFDSYSTDRTVEIAKAAGARVVQRTFDNWSTHQNWAVENIDFKNEWVWYVDADEVILPDLAKEILEVTSDPYRPEVAYKVRRKNIFLGKWLKHGGMYNVWIARLWKPQKIRWQRYVHPIAIIDGPVGYLRNCFIHNFINKGFAAWFDRHNKYSTFEALETIKELKESKIDWKGLFSHQSLRRRSVLKCLSFRLPGRPFLKFIYMYLLKGGILDGRAGLSYSAMMSIYEYMICLKVRELRRREKGLPV